jgi:cytochrome P450
MQSQLTQADWNVPAHIPPELVAPFDFMRGDYVQAFPPRAMESFREQRAFFSPLYGGFWVLNRYEDIRECFQDADRFGQSPTGTIPVLAFNRRMIPSTIDGPEHLKWRQILVPMFAPKTARALEPMLRSVASETVKRIADQGHCEFLKDYALQLPILRFCHELGLEDDVADELLHLGNEVTYGVDRVAADVGLEAAQAHRAHYGAKIEEMLVAVVAKRRAAPGEDIVSSMLAAQYDGVPVTDDDVLNILTLLFFAGTDSSSGAIAYAMLHLATHPEDRARFVAHPEERDGLVEELLRLGAVHYIARRVTRDTEFAGVSMKAGDMVSLPTAAANRDPEVFTDPGSFQPTRSGPAHVTFGLGRHRCLGMHQARLELRVALDEFHAVIPEYELDPTTPIEYICGVRSRPNALPLIYPSSAS